MSGCDDRDERPMHAWAMDACVWWLWVTDVASRRQSRAVRLTRVNASMPGQQRESTSFLQDPKTDEKMR